jgi:hypothetical protein
MNKQIHSLILTILTSFAVISFHHQNFSAYAGGFDNPSSQYAPHSMSYPDMGRMSGQAAQMPQPLKFNWRDWSFPYTVGDRVCREQQGNLVCLTPTTAKKMDWQMHALRGISP